MKMYKSPIDIIHGQIETQLEGEVLRAVQKCGVVVDKDELIRALNDDRQQYEQGYKDAMERMRWISVSERLPEERGEYLCYYVFEPASPNVICENTYYGSGHWLSEMDKVTHWMPLPTPPKGE